MNFSGFKRVFFSVHFFIVAGLLALFCFPLAWPMKLPNEFWLKQVLIHFFWGGLFYLNLLYLTPKLLYKNRVAVFILLLVAILFIVVRVDGWLDDITGWRVVFTKTFPQKAHDGNNPDAYWPIFAALVLLGVSTIIAISKKIKLDQEAIQATEKDKIITELSLLKAQINPHFFFNILHTIYALADTNTAASKDAIYTLSHMMRYVIYETKNDLTTLEKEIKFAEDFIKLMKLRLSDNVQVIFEKQANLKNSNLAPMLFLPFIENAFKHGVSDVNPSYIYIDIREIGNSLVLEIKNSTFETKAQFLEDSNGIGVANTKRRLDLLYPGKHSLTIDDDPHTMEFTVKLTLDPK